MTVYDVVKKLIGPIGPIGDSREDMTRCNNLIDTLALVDALLEDIIAVSRARNLPMPSMQTAGKHAFDWCKETAQQLDEVGK
jgi:hypothetical protein